MGRIEAPLGQIDSVGAGIAGLAAHLSGAQCTTNIGGSFSEPPASATALESLSARWQTAMERLDHEITTLGTATQATAVAYRVTDETAIGGSQRAANDGAGAGGGGGGGGSW